MWIKIPGPQPQRKRGEDRRTVREQELSESTVMGGGNQGPVVERSWRRRWPVSSSALTAGEAPVCVRKFLRPWKHYSGCRHIR